MDALRELIRSGIKEELSKLQAPHTTATLSVVNVVRNELRQIIPNGDRRVLVHAPEPTHSTPTSAKIAVAQALPITQLTCFFLTVWAPFYKPTPGKLKQVTCGGIPGNGPAPTASRPGESFVGFFLEWDAATLRKRGRCSPIRNHRGCTTACNHTTGPPTLTSTWTAPSQPTSSLPPAIKEQRPSAALRGLGSCATSQRTYRFALAMVLHLLLPALVNPSLDFSWNGTLPPCESEAGARQYAIIAAAPLLATTLPDPPTLTSTWTAPSQPTSSLPPAIKEQRPSAALRGLDSCATSQRTYRFALVMQDGQVLELSQVNDIRAGGIPKDVRLLAELSSKNRYGLDEVSLTICSGTDMVNINYTHVVCPDPETAKVRMVPFTVSFSCGIEDNTWANPLAVQLCSTVIELIDRVALLDARRPTTVCANKDKKPPPSTTSCSEDSNQRVLASSSANLLTANSNSDSLGSRGPSLLVRAPTAATRVTCPMIGHLFCEEKRAKRENSSHGTKTTSSSLANCFFHSMSGRSSIVSDTANIRLVRVGIDRGANISIMSANAVTHNIPMHSRVLHENSEVLSSSIGQTLAATLGVALGTTNLPLEDVVIRELRRSIGLILGSDY
ncbi:hypothetical protein HPB51_017641 [Rhipicephalus microplus]|uniref:PLC-beta PH domain-containing protein n=1 Tax=Rhipicephalus microplus TaxID=6941 RepID=A0A9J6E1V0_RHIMP|nr:hypothetical protein HPB51_017641 [Rhipicephalus microplus]